LTSPKWVFLSEWGEVQENLNLTSSNATIDEVKAAVYNIVE
jgi:hypothetical protein